jgi:hypothetical protein
MPKVISLQKAPATKLLKPWKANTLEAKLCRMADKLGIHPKDLRSYVTQMRKFGIQWKEVTDSAIRKAVQLDRMWQDSLRERAEAIGAIWR